MSQTPPPGPCHSNPKKLKHSLIRQRFQLTTVHCLQILTHQWLSDSVEHSSKTTQCHCSLQVEIWSFIQACSLTAVIYPSHTSLLASFKIAEMFVQLGVNFTYQWKYKIAVWWWRLQTSPTLDASGRPKMLPNHLCLKWFSTDTKHFGLSTSTGNYLVKRMERLVIPTRSLTLKYLHSSCSISAVAPVAVVLSCPHACVTVSACVKSSTHALCPMILMNVTHKPLTTRDLLHSPLLPQSFRDRDSSFHPPASISFPPQSNGELYVSMATSVLDKMN